MDVVTPTEVLVLEVDVVDVVKVVPVPLAPTATSVTLTQNLFGSFATGW